MLTCPAKLTQTVKNAILAVKERNGWTYRQFAEAITERLPSGKTVLAGGVNQWTGSNSGTPSTITSYNFKALYPIIAEDLKRLEWVPQDPRVKKFVDRFENKCSRQGKLFDDEIGSTGQTVEPEAAVKAVISEPETEVEEQEAGMMMIRCAKCNSDLDSRWDAENGNLVASIQPCETCTKKLRTDAAEQLISKIRSI